MINTAAFSRKSDDVADHIREAEAWLDDCDALSEGGPHALIAIALVLSDIRDELRRMNGRQP